MKILSQLKISSRKLLTPLLILIVSLMLTGFAWQKATEIAYSENEGKFNDIVMKSNIYILGGIDKYVDIIYGARGLFVASEKVNRNEWDAYINSLPIDERFPGMQALSFIARVPIEEKESFIKEVQVDTSLSSEGYPDFTIHPEGDREEYYVVTYIEPFKGNEDAFGFDLFSNSSRRVGLEEARDTNAPIATAPIRLVQEKGEQSGFLVFLPVYKNGMPIETAEERQEAIIGFISAVFRADDLLTALLDTFPEFKSVRLEVVDTRAQKEGETNFSIFNQYEEDYFDYKFVAERDISVGGREWMLSFHELPGFAALAGTKRYVPIAVLFVGILFSMLIFIVLYSFASTKVRATQLAQTLTKDLKKFQLAVENASDHIVITDTKGIILYANSAAEKITGYSKKEMVGVKAGSLWGGKMDKTFYQNMWKVIKENKKSFVGELANTRKNGEKYEAQIRISPVFGEKKNILFFVGIERDITKEKQIDRAKTEFVSLASHQLRTPLTSINWYAEMLLDGDAGKLTKEQKQFVSEIYQGNKRMVDLVNALLNVSRINLGTFAIEPEPIKIIEIAESILDELKPQILEKQMDIEKRYDKDIPIIRADSKLIRIVFQNLLSNAIKYTPEKGKVILDISKQDKNLLIKVIDTGYGIPKNQQSKIFTKLFRADNIQQKNVEGNGLGLYIVKSIVDESGGKIWFESDENKGAAFYVTLPLKGMKKKEGAKGLS